MQSRTCMHLYIMDTLGQLTGCHKIGIMDTVTMLLIAKFVHSLPRALDTNYDEKVMYLHVQCM